VKLAWKSRKNKWSEIPVSVSSSRAPEGVEAPTDVVPLKLTTQKPRKSVTWADLVAGSAEDAHLNRIPAENVDGESSPAKKGAQPFDEHLSINNDNLHRHCFLRILSTFYQSSPRESNDSLYRSYFGLGQRSLQFIRDRRM
jgi:hypothetical protein